MIRWFISIIALFNIVLTIAQDDIQALGSLPDAIKETSGLLFYNNRLITHNDSGDAAHLYEVDTSTREILRTITISNATHTDWEDIAQDDNYIYVGDFGNNNGTRQDLGIYKILKADFLVSDTVMAEFISFSYEDQSDFTPNSETDWDAESLFVVGTNLIVLTKQWSSFETVAYKIPNTAGTHTATRMDSYAVNGLVTGADFDAESNTLLIIGHSTVLLPFLITATNVSESSIFSGTVEKTALSGIGITQMEAISKAEDLIYTTSEEFTNTTFGIELATTLFSFTLNTNAEEEQQGEEEQEENEEEQGEEQQEEEEQEGNPNEMEEIELGEGLFLQKSFGSNILNYQLNSSESIRAQAIFDTSGRMVRYYPLESIESSSIDISTLNNALYYLTFYLRESIISKPFFKD